MFPLTGHFTQADTLIPEPGKASAFDRYAYVLNNPIIYNDPEGHKACGEDDDCRKTKSSEERIEEYKKKLKDKYDIKIVGDNWELAELIPIYIGITKMEKGIDTITNGEGGNWINKNIGGTDIDIASFGSELLKSNYVTDSTIHVFDNFQNMGYGNYPEERSDTMIIHEIGHVFDNNLKGSKGVSQAIFIGGGPSDQLMKFAGGESTSILRFQTNSLSMKDPEKYFGDKNGYGYGNNSTVDYFAHSFTASVVSPNSPNAPSISVSWVSALIYLTK